MGIPAILVFAPEGPFAIPEGDYKIESVIDRILASQEKNGAKRLVINPASRLNDERSSNRRDYTIDKFTFFLQNGFIKEKRKNKLPLTTLLTAESAEGRFTEEHYGAHGVIRLSFERKENTKVRTLEILKMRRTMHSMDYVEYEIGVDGIDVIA